MNDHTPAGDRSLESWVVGAVGVVLALGGFLAFDLWAAPWEIRFPLITAACLYGPAIPALRLFTGVTLMECVVYGIGVNVALLMLVSLALVMAHSWFPYVAVFVLLLASLGAGAKLMMINAGT
jgi:hypothetical protein